MDFLDRDQALPLGLTMNLAQDIKAMEYFANLSDVQQAQIVDYIQSATNGEEAKQRIEEVVTRCHNDQNIISN